MNLFINKDEKIRLERKGYLGGVFFDIKGLGSESSQDFPQFTETTFHNNHQLFVLKAFGKIVVFTFQKGVKVTRQMFGYYTKAEIIYTKLISF